MVWFECVKVQFEEGLFPSIGIQCYLSSYPDTFVVSYMFIISELLSCRHTDIIHVSTYLFAL